MTHWTNGREYRVAWWKLPLKQFPLQLQMIKQPHTYPLLCHKTQEKPRSLFWQALHLFWCLSSCWWLLFCSLSGISVLSWSAAQLWLFRKCCRRRRRTEPFASEQSQDNSSDNEEPMYANMVKPRRSHWQDNTAHETGPKDDEPLYSDARPVMPSQPRQPQTADEIIYCQVQFNTASSSVKISKESDSHSDKETVYATIVHSWIRRTS